MAPPLYRGRFAPTPSGPLHFGSLVAAMASYLDACAHGGEWLVRMEDVDPPRVAPGAADRILHTLELYGFQWHSPVMYQSRRGAAYCAALAELQRLGQVYRCICSRKTLTENARRGVDGLVYPGACRALNLDTKHAGMRFRMPAGRAIFDDAIQGRVACDLVTECGDFILQRADGVYSYQLAVTVDDAEQGISHVVRGADLLTSTPRQIALQQALGLPAVRYAHLPVALDEHGDKLSKQTLATAIDAADPLPALKIAACFLGLMPPAGLANPDEFWRWAVAAWPSRIARPVRGYRPTPCNS
ncbi:MAG: tRNA glutamyl-Q(34) synthetase GluQRS [Hydrogenophilales bacterium CG03_land_8_20_14_0_80_62_28]|nr:tRNA glutamyl-Q(34) synthetase GluQRS [Betaproteobacteria bacterium]OIO79696.1 MAG: tRNA glutamyl-Q(34) synthetase GluQRS [Hydrogenophilaceae bacterium CG1_02_62_390]PIV23518.1 MAG: tRNA glutamyl-Q(34) synthetase GluQRS [Hydrogenophilales bacterium CG03_land_8_20_14_0_80_62_28]PIW38778.1 MAG: tRNA glutamyl-Q(34) synthetase GluQRS [Hydrogenophilales bacterium CG15_BIG_FIL_POST_REV_8_21_14_020_62_31]PIW71721.1 MAG: tRNA glutamyl-Q(34) synthetase GluQRS [Hydrogenophilales bacterium CG12_big_fil